MISADSFSTYDTSTHAASGVLNYVVNAYNGLGQITSQEQVHGGSGPGSLTSGTVSYAYDSDNGSRLISMTYPNGRVEDYQYVSVLDAAISRISAIADDYDYLGGDTPLPVQSYSYLGVGTIVQELDANGVALSYIQQSGDTLAGSDGGDQYTGLDRFGRVVDQNWYNTGTDSSNERFQYAYDQDAGKRAVQIQHCRADLAVGVVSRQQLRTTAATIPPPTTTSAS